MRRAIAVALALLVLASSTTLAAKGRSSRRSGSKGSSSTHSGSSKPVHVKEHTTKDGTHFEAHDRKAPEPKTAPSSQPKTTYSPSPIRIYTDPVTGRKTITNEPIAPLASSPLPSAATTHVPSTARSMRIASSTSAVTATRKASTTHPARVLPHQVATGVTRDAKGRFARTEAAKHAFEVQTGYPHGRPGYVVDHIKPLACGGADAPNNMQWQTVAEAKAKDKTERTGCR